MEEPNFTFWLGDEADAARDEVLAELGGCMIDMPDMVVMFVPEVDLTDPQDELG
jgi:hypothetical protein